MHAYGENMRLCEDRHHHDPVVVISLKTWELGARLASLAAYGSEESPGPGGDIGL